jgi:nucleotide-binding universal stress UspA family protein
MHLEDWAKEALKKALPETEDDPEEWVREELSKKTDEVVCRLEGKGYAAHSHVLTGHPNDVIHHSVTAFAADILILGGQGHGFIERLVVGSVALHQAVAEPYSLLIVRP